MCKTATLKKTFFFQEKSSPNAGQSIAGALFSSFIKLPFVIKIFVLSILSGRFRQVLL